MPSVIDELITRFKLDDQQYDSAAKKVVALTNQITDAIKSASDQAADFGRGIAERFKISEVFAPLAAIATAGGLIDLGKDAIETANKFDVLERKLAGVTGSYQVAKGIMSYNEGQSASLGLFNPQELDAASLKLEAFGLSSQQYIPLIEQLGAVFGDLDEPISALGRIAEGDAGRAIRMLERMGISIDSLRQKGVAFRGTQILGSPQQALGAIQAVVAEKYGGVLTEAEGDNQAKLTRISVAWENSMRTVGETLQKYLLPPLTKVADWLTKFTESGALTKIVNDFAKLFGLDGSNLTNALSTVAGVVAAIPRVLEGVFSAFAAVFDFIWNQIQWIGAAWVGIWTMDMVLQGIKAVQAAIIAVEAATGGEVTLLSIVKALMGDWKALAAAVVVAGIAAAGAWAIIGHFKSELQGSFDKGNSLIRAAADAAKEAMFRESGTRDHNQLVDAANQQTTFLSQIAENTKALTVDLRKYAFGGGDLGRMGVTATEMGSYRHSLPSGGGGSSRISPRATQMIVAGIDAAIGDLQGRQMAGAMRQGFVSSQ